MRIDDQLRPPVYVEEGMVVIAPYEHEGKRVGLRCIVTCAAGYHAEVSNEQFGFRKWFHINRLRIEGNWGESS